MVAITTNLYLPSLGGSIEVARRLAVAMVAAGERVTILTCTSGEDGCQSIEEWRSRSRDDTLVVCRFRAIRAVVEVLQEADAVISIEMSLHWVLKAVLAGKRPLITHHTHFVDSCASPPLYRRLQKLLARFLPSMACSAQVAEGWGKHVKVLPNPYDSSVFFDRGMNRDVDYLFVGRMELSKGPWLFLEAMQVLRSEGQHFRFAMVGGGPESGALQQAVKEVNLDDALVFLDRVEPADLSVWYNRARIVVIPSLWNEPFGLVGLEALACGAHVVTSDQPGLREATGGLAFYVKTGSVENLVSALRNPTAIRDKNLVARERHLVPYQATNSAAAVMKAAGLPPNIPDQST